MMFLNPSVSRTPSIIVLSKPSPNSLDPPRPVTAMDGFPRDLPSPPQADASEATPETVNGSVIPSVNFALLEFTPARMVHVRMRAVGQQNLPVVWGEINQFVTVDRTTSGIVDPTNGPPLYAISSVWFLHDVPDLVLHSGITWNSHPLASMVTVEGQSGVRIALPPLRVGEAQSEEHVNCPPGKPKKNRVYKFQIEVESWNNGSMTMVREPFEWRKGTGYYGRELGRAKGWELVRMSGVQGGGRLTSDGKEIVAGCSKGFNFLRVGSGEKELGSRWALMAFMTSLCIMQHRYG